MSVTFQKQNYTTSRQKTGR